MKRKIGGIALASMIAALLCTPAVLADEPQTSAAGASSGTEPAASPGAGAPAPEAGAPSASSSQPEVTPGPLEADRKVLLGHIQQAGAHGIGIANYMMAFNAIEDQVRHGAAETQLKPRVEQLNNALLEQLKRAQILKTQRPLPPTTSQQADAPPGTAPAAPATAAAPAGTGSPLGNLGSLSDKLGGLNIPDSLKEKLLNSDQAKQILKRLGQ